MIRTFFCASANMKKIKNLIKLNQVHTLGICLTVNYLDISIRLKSIHFHFLSAAFCDAAAGIRSNSATRASVRPGTDDRR